MVGTLAGLQLRLYRRGLARSTGAIVTAVLAGLYAVGLLVAAGVLALGLPSTTTPATRAALVCALFGVVMVLRLFALFVSGQDQSLDPARFALLPMPARRLQPGLLVAAFCTPGPWFLMALVALSAVAFRDHPGLALLALGCGGVGLVLSTLMCRVLVAALSGVLHARRFRDVAGVVVAVLAMSAGVLVQLLTHALGRSTHLEQVRPVSTALGWTPFGWAWAVMGDVIAHHWLLLGVRVALVVVGGAVLWWCWGRLLDRALTSPLESGGGASQVRTGTLAERLTPSTPAGGIASRTLRYYRRDPRHVMQLITMVMLPVLMVLPQVSGSNSRSLSQFGRGALLVPMFVGLMVGSTSLAQETSLDGSALWMQIVTGVPGRSDRWGRLYAFALIAVPVVVLIDVAFALLTHQQARLLVMTGATLGALGASSAVGTVSGALVQTPQPPPGSSPFARGSGGGVAAAVAAFAAMIASAVLCAPFAIAGWLVWGRPALMWVPLALAIVLVPLLCWAACVLGGRILDRSWPEVLQRVTWSK